MSTKLKTILSLLLCMGVGSVLKAQTIELVTGNFVGTPALGPTTSSIGPAAMRKDNSENNHFTDATGSQACSVTFSLANQQYSFANGTMLNYSNISTGLVFGASPTTATGGVAQGVDPLDTYRLLGSYSQTPGGPTDNMFTAKFNGTAGTGIDADGIFSPPANDASGSIVVFTAAQAQFERPAGGPPSTHNSSTRYYYGDLTILLSRFVDHPVIHIAGLGGSYRYFPTTGTNVNDPSQWQSCFFSTELELVGNFSLTKLSGNEFFTVSGNNITNSATNPNGASVHTTGGLFDEYGAASGSVSVNGPVRGITFRVYLRGANSSQFSWSAPSSVIAGASRNPFTGDIWSVSVSNALDQQIPLPVTGMHLDAVLNSHNDVLLNWKTYSEIDSKEFEIQRSTDGINFTTIGTKAAAGNSASQLSYAFTDPDMQASVYYYRLKQVDINNDFAYSNVVPVRKARGDVKSVRAFPNPSAGQLNLEFSKAKGNYVISLINQGGQEVATQKAVVSYDVQYITVNRNSLPAGSYILKVRNAESGEVFNQNVILQ